MAYRPGNKVQQPQESRMKKPTPAKPKMAPAVKLRTYKGMEGEGLREVFEAHVRQYSTVAEAARAFDVSRAYLNNILTKERAISEYIAGRLGYQMRVIYEPMTPTE